MSEENKEELRKKFYDHLQSKYPKEKIDFSDVDWAFDFFYSEILSRENANTILKGALQFRRQDVAERDARLSQAEELLRLADEMAKSLHFDNRPNWMRLTVSTEAALEAYNTLKNKP